MPDVIQVTPDNFCRAETDRYFSDFVKEGGLGRFFHNREPTPLDRQKVVRMNRDTLYSSAVFDLDAAPVTITLPDPGTRFMSLQIWDEDEYCPLVAYGQGSHELTREKVGTRFAAAAVRILVDPSNPDDVKRVHALQDAITVKQTSPGTFEVPNWDPVSQKKVRDALEILGKTLPDTHRTFGPKTDVDPVRHLIGAAIGWGGNPAKDAFYLNLTPQKNDGKTRHRVHVPADVPVDGFWSISVYNKNGFFEPNPQHRYAINSITAQKNADGSVDIQFGGCNGAQTNCIPIMPGWNAAVRLYRPHPDVLDGTWRFPELQPIE
jgi:hypothetical protein